MRFQSVIPASSKVLAGSLGQKVALKWALIQIVSIVVINFALEVPAAFTPILYWKRTSFV